MVATSSWKHWRRYYGPGAGLVAYVVVSLLTPPTPADVLQVWDDRLAGRDDARVTTW